MSEEIGDRDFDKKVLERSKQLPVIVDFYADWCMPCKTLEPILEKIAEEYGDRLVLVKVNVNNAPENTQKYRILSIPNVKIFKDGKVVDEFIGSLPENKVREWLEKNL